MSEHETHLIYFERYLRNKLPVEDRQVFEHKLTTDSEFRSAFLHYKKNRKSYLDELFDEPKPSHQKFSLSNTIYLLITTISLAVSILYYLDNQLMRKLLKGQIGLVKKNTTPAIPVPIIEKGVNIQNTNTAFGPKQVQEVTTEYYSENAATAFSDEIFIADTVINIITTSRNDSTAIPNETSQMAVELWKSPLNYYGYHYNGNKLIIFGIESFDNISVEEYNNELWLNIGENLYLIQNTNTYVKF